tara:strand:+ start:128 stop:319 length:192 start_codon:yes stop_codon:yes gene_type:complete
MDDYELNLFTSIIVFIIGFLFARIFKNRPITHGPNSNDIKRTVFKDKNNNYYKFTPYPVICPI